MRMRSVLSRMQRRAPRGALRLAVAILVVLFLLGCEASPEDDQFGREFIHNVRTGNPAGAKQLEPGGELAAIGWRVVAQQARHLPDTVPDSVVLAEWSRQRDRLGVSRKLTYRVHFEAECSIVELWLVELGGAPYVNTVRMTGPRDCRDIRQ